MFIIDQRNFHLMKLLLISLKSHQIHLGSRFFLESNGKNAWLGTAVLRRVCATGTMAKKCLMVSALLCAVLFTLANCQTTPYFRMNCGTNGSAWPRCGFTSEAQSGRPDLY